MEYLRRHKYSLDAAVDDYFASTAATSDDDDDDDGSSAHQKHSKENEKLFEKYKGELLRMYFCSCHIPAHIIQISYSIEISDWNQGGRRS